MNVDQADQERSRWLEEHSTDLLLCLSRLYRLLERMHLPRSECIWVLPSEWKPQFWEGAATVLEMPVVWAEVDEPLISFSLSQEEGKLTPTGRLPRNRRR